jgi:plastocyanin
MRRTAIITFVALTALALAGLSGIASGASPNAAAPPVKTVAIKAGCGAGYFCFKPGPATVKRGTKVVWKNTSGVTHDIARCTVAACHMSGGTGKQIWPKSKPIGNGKSYSFTFTKPGTYRYYCTIHGYATMHGTITVR